MPLSLLQRLAEAVPELDEVDVDLSFFRDDMRRIRVTGAVQARMQLQCQRCMQNYAAVIDATVTAAVVWSDEQARQLPVELDPWLAEENLDLASAVEDELLLALPTMTVHPQEECSGASHYSTEPVVKSVTTHKPFAGLSDLKKSSDTNT
jgi:DUF177 domain-containing protein